MGKESIYITSDGDKTTTGLAATFVIFAGIILILVGCYQAIIGIAALTKEDFFIVNPNYAYKIDTTAWGWIHLIFGVLMVSAGIGAMAGQLWARAFAIFITALNAIANFFFVPYYPAWPLVTIILSVFIIWALTVHGRPAPVVHERRTTAEPGSAS